MLCPKCNCQYDIYNAVVNDNTGYWECPDDGENSQTKMLTRTRML